MFLVHCRLSYNVFGASSVQSLSLPDAQGSTDLSRRCGRSLAADMCTELRQPPPTYPHKLLIDVLCQVLAAQHSCARARCVADNAANDDTQHIRLSRQPGRQGSTQAILSNCWGSTATALPDQNPLQTRAPARMLHSVHLPPACVRCKSGAPGPVNAVNQTQRKVPAHQLPVFPIHLPPACVRCKSGAPVNAVVQTQPTVPAHQLPVFPILSLPNGCNLAAVSPLC
jgi:hypothetical protein